MLTFVPNIRDERHEDTFSYIESCSDIQKVVTHALKTSRTIMTTFFNKNQFKKS